MVVRAVGSLVKMIAPTLDESGFARAGKLFYRSEGDLYGIIEISLLSKPRDEVTEFRVEWGIVLPGSFARHHPYGGPENLSNVYAALGRALAPPPKHYAGLFPRERGIDAVWGVPEGSREGVQECADALRKGLKKDVLPIVLDLLKPGALLEEIYAKKNKSRLSYGTWQCDAILLLLEDGPIAQVRELASQLGPEMDEFLEWVERRLRQREREKQV